MGIKYGREVPDTYWKRRNKINTLQTKNIQTFLVGGTGFYIDAVTNRLKLEPNTTNNELRKKLEDKTLEALQTQYKELTGNTKDRDINESDFQNKRRLVRRIEKMLFEKKAYQSKEGEIAISSNITKNTVQVENKNVINQILIPDLKMNKIHYIGLTAPRETLYQRADEWLDAIWVNGLVEETNTLLQKYPTNEKLKGLIYKSVVAFLHKELSEDEAKQRAKFDIHAYIRRQETWFKKNTDITWLDITKANYPKDAIELVLSLLSQ